MRGKDDQKSGREVDSLKIDKLMKDFGFNPEASTSTARALILNLVRSAYGPEAAREFMRQMNLEKNRGLDASQVMDQFKADRAAELERTTRPLEIPGVGTAETQLSLFDADAWAEGSREAHPGDDIPCQQTGTFHQKKSRRA